MLTWHKHGQGCSAIDFGLSTAAFCGCFCMAVMDGWCFLLHAKCQPCTGRVFWMSSTMSQYLSFVRQLLECWWVFGFPLVLDGCVWGIGSQWSTIRSPSHHKGAQALIYECKMKSLYWVHPRKKNKHRTPIWKGETSTNHQFLGSMIVFGGVSIGVLIGGLIHFGDFASWWWWRWCWRCWWVCPEVIAHCFRPDGHMWHVEATSFGGPKHLQGYVVHMIYMYITYKHYQPHVLLICTHDTLRWMIHTSYIYKFLHDYATLFNTSTWQCWVFPVAPAGKPPQVIGKSKGFKAPNRKQLSRNL